MINEIEGYIKTLNTGITFGQIQDTPNNLINVNIYDTGNTPFFNDTKTHILNITVFVRNDSYVATQSNMEEIVHLLSETYDYLIETVHIINTKKINGNEPNRDDKNRYSLISTLEMIVEERGEH